MKIKKYIPESKYEKESFFKSFFIYFLSIFFLIITIFYFQYQNVLSEKKYLLFLEMKNFSLTFKGEKFKLDLVPLKEAENIYYELLENKEEFYMYVPIPGSNTDVLKVSYPKKQFYNLFYKYINNLIIFYSVIILLILIISIGFALYTTYPLRKAIHILDETIKDIIHDINTPVMSIILNLKLLKMKYKDEEDINRLELAVKQLSSIYENLKVALKEAEKLIDEVKLGDIIQSEITTLKSIYPEIKVDISLEDVKVKSDKNAVERIIFNVLSNAFKHNIKNGYVKIILNNKSLLVENSSPEIKYVNRLFDRFYKESQRGIGLGLSIVKKLSEEVGWKVKIETERGIFKVIINWECPPNCVKINKEK